MVRTDLVVLLITVSFTLGVGNAYADDTPADIAGSTGCDILASLLKNPTATVAASSACKFGTDLARDTVADLINKYFEDEDQKFANKYCLTIVNADGTKVTPTDKTNCS